MTRFWNLDQADVHVIGIEALIAKATLIPEEEAHQKPEAQVAPITAEWSLATRTKGQTSISLNICAM